MTARCIVIANEVKQSRAWLWDCEMVRYIGGLLYRLKEIASTLPGSRNDNLGKG